jgi:hypothetical protein
MPLLTHQPPGRGPGWERLAAALRDALPAAVLDGLWVLRPRRHGPREYGTAILSRVDGDRRRIYTAWYALTIKGKQRGEFDWGLREIGTGPVEALEELCRLVPARGVDDEPPEPIAPALWFPDASQAGEQLAETHASAD